MSKQTDPKPPPHLREPTRQWWQGVVDAFELEDHHIRLLTLAGEAWDRCCEAREALAEHGITFIDRFDQPRARPEVAIERDSRVAFARLVRELGLPAQDEPDEAPRPPRIAGRYEGKH